MTNNIREINGLYYDEHDLPVHLDGGGDGLQRLGFTHVAFEMRRRLGISNREYPPQLTGNSHFTRSIEKLRSGDFFIRSPNPPYNKPFDKFSPGRDQFRPILAACALYESYSATSIAGDIEDVTKIIGGWQNWSLTRAHRKSSKILLDDLGYKKLPFGFAVRGDIVSPEDKNFFRRALIGDPSLLGDAFMWGMSKVIARKTDPDDVGDDLNHIVALVLSHEISPTWMSKKALRCYIETRPPNNGTIKLGEKNPIMGAIAHYFSEPSAPRGMIELWRPIIDRLFSI